MESGHPRTVTDLGKIISSGKHLLSLINDVLDLSKIEAGKTELRPEAFLVNSMFGEALDTAESLGRANHNRLIGHCDVSETVMFTDRVKFRQVLFNLVSNACKFTKNGTISLDVTISHRELRWIHWRVRDTGIGIPHSKRDKLFLAFSQLDQSTTREYGGSGLGLAISQRLCGLMGGYIDVESEEGLGSTFTINLPLDPPIASTEHLSQTTAHSTSFKAQDSTSTNETVLVIDDDPMARELLERLLTREGYRVLEAEDGDRGLVLAAAARPMAIVLDILMPGSSGWAVLSKLKQTPELARIPVIVHSVSDDRALGRELGVAAFLQKPPESGELASILLTLSKNGQSSPERTTLA